MTELHLDADRMPVVARHESVWSPGELAHLHHCSECRAEWEMIQVAARLGVRAVALDPGRVARSVLGRLGAEPTLARSRFRRNAVRLVGGLAAAAGLVLAGRLTLDRAAPAVPPGVQTVLHELDGMNASELETLLESLPAATDSTAHPEPASFDELDAKSLERLLRSLEG